MYYEENDSKHYFVVFTLPELGCSIPNQIGL